MGNLSYGKVWDVYDNPAVLICLLITRGMSYKTVGQLFRYIKCTTRTMVPPIGAVPGYEDILQKKDFSNYFSPGDQRDGAVCREVL